MKAVAYIDSLDSSDTRSLMDFELPAPTPGPRDLLVRVEAVSVNPVDTKIRKRLSGTPESPKILGWDAAGIVEATGPDVSRFRVGDRVWYAGDLNRPGSNAEFQVVDERIVGHCPESLSASEAAALPLTALTAWELLFDRLHILQSPEKSGQNLLIVGAAGGVGSILIQLATQLTGATVIASASREQTQRWVRDQGAHQVVDHRSDLGQELGRIGISQVSPVISLNGTADHFDTLVELMAPQGQFALIDDPEPAIDIRKLKQKSISLHWEFMYTRSLFQTPDMQKQGEILDEIARLVDQKVLLSTMTANLGPINAANLRKAHAQLESGQTIGKLVLTGF